MLFLRKKPPPPEQMILTPFPGDMGMKESSVNRDNEDFADRRRFHHSSIVNGNNFVEDQSMSAIQAIGGESDEEFSVQDNAANLMKSKTNIEILKSGENQPLLVDTKKDHKPSM